MSTRLEEWAAQEVIAAMGEWFSENAWAVWLIAAVVLSGAELLTLDLALLMLGIGALAGMVTSLFLPGMILVQVIVAVITAVIALFVLRPPLLAKARSAKGYQASYQQVLGSHGVSAEEITSSSGSVRVGGDTWTARAYDPAIRIAPGEEVEVLEVEGLTLRVHPRNQPLDSGSADRL